MEFIAFPIGGTTLTKTLDQLAAVFSTVQPTLERSRASRGAANPATDHNAKIHDCTMFKLLLDSLMDLAKSRLLCIIKIKKRLVDDLPGGVRHHRSNSDASLAHHQATYTHQQGAATHTRRTRTTRPPESTAIT